MLARANAEFPEQVAALVRAAGGTLIGRTRFQKMVYLLQLAGFLNGFRFEYRHYGPYSEDLSRALLAARLEGELLEEERAASWGGSYSIYKATGPAPEVSSDMHEMIDISKSANPIALELAATAAYLALDGEEKPWVETIRRKADKSAYLEEAKKLYLDLSKAVPGRLPIIRGSTH